MNLRLSVLLLVVSLVIANTATAHCSPSLGRWLERDPIDVVEVTNLYECDGSNPISRIDPHGLDWRVIEEPGRRTYERRQQPERSGNTIRRGGSFSDWRFNATAREDPDMPGCCYLDIAASMPIRSIWFTDNEAKREELRESKLYDAYWRDLMRGLQSWRDLAEGNRRLPCDILKTSAEFLNAGSDVNGLLAGRDNLLEDIARHKHPYYFPKLENAQSLLRTRLGEFQYYKEKLYRQIGEFEENCCAETENEE